MHRAVIGLVLVLLSSASSSAGVITFTADDPLKSINTGGHPGRIVGATVSFFSMTALYTLYDRELGITLES